MARKKKKDLKTKIKSGLKTFFNSPLVMIIALTILVIILIGINNHLMKSSKTYMFSGKSDYVSVVNGVISLNYDVNLLAGSDITYLKEKDITVVKYSIGYHIPKGSEFMPLAIKTGTDEVGFSLQGLINEVSAFNIVEPYQNKSYFDKEKIRYLDRGLYFIIEAETKDGDYIYDKVQMKLTKVSK